MVAACGCAARRRLSPLLRLNLRWIREAAVAAVSAQQRHSVHSSGSSRTCTLWKLPHRVHCTETVCREAVCARRTACYSAPVPLRLLFAARLQNTGSFEPSRPEFSKRLRARALSTVLVRPQPKHRFTTTPSTTLKPRGASVVLAALLKDWELSMLVWERALQKLATEFVVDMLCQHGIKNTLATLAIRARD
eukprot:1485116-Prymnesium_polylepis.1